MSKTSTALWESIRSKAVQTSWKAWQGRAASESGVHYAMIKSGSSETWTDKISAGAEKIEVNVGDGASLTWHCGRESACETSSRDIVVTLGAGSRFEMIEAFEVAENQAHGERLVVDFAGPGSSAKIVSRWAQCKGSTLCQEALGRIGPNARGARFAQSAKAIRLGKPRATLLEPNLRVEVDEASATHGAAHGAVDADLMHALMSRGLGHAQAQKMLVDAFLGAAWSGVQMSGPDRQKLGLAPEEQWT